MNRISNYIFPLSFVLLLATAGGCTKSDSDTEYSGTGSPTVKEPSSDIFATADHMGVNYGPFHFDGQNSGSAIPLSQIQADLDLIARNFKFIRTYTVDNGMDKVPQEAASRGIEVSLGVHCTPNDQVKTKADIDLAVSVTSQYPTTVTSIVVGNETNQDGPNYVSDAEVAAYMDYAKQKMNAASLSGISVSSCITGVGGLPGGSGNDHACPLIMQRCRDLNLAGDRVIFMTIYPYYGQKYNSQNHPSDIGGNMNWSYQNGMAQAEQLGLDVVIGEIGWPSQGNDQNMENPGNESLNFTATLNWINGINDYKKAFNTLWFSMFDEPWKTNEPFGVGPYWGLYAKNGATQPKFTIPKLR